MKSPWSNQDLDLEGYLQAVGVPAQTPAVAALGRLQRAHMRRHSFDNVDVLLGSLQGVALAQVQDKFVARGRGGYCYEHMTLFGAVMETLGYPVARHLGRVHEVTGARTHMTVITELDGQRWMVDAGFGFGPTGPVLLEDGVITETDGWRWRVTRSGEGPSAMWHLEREAAQGWELMHATDDVPVTPRDVVVANHFSSTSPEAVFTQNLYVMRYLPDRHVTLFGRTVTTRRPGEPTEQHELAPGELQELLPQLASGLTTQQVQQVVERWG